MSSQVQGPPGWRIRKEITRPDPALVARLGAFPPAVISDALGRRSVMEAGIKPLDPALTMAGPAVTIEVRAADNMMIHAGIALAQKGDVLVINAHGDVSSAVFGGILAQAVAAKGLAGLVVDGAVRDSEEIRGFRLPVFCRAVTPVGPDRDGPGQVNMAISCGGVPVMPGDVVVGDGDGVIVVPPDMIETAIKGAEAREAQEAQQRARIARGQINQDWLVPALRAKGCLGEDESL